MIDIPALEYHLAHGCNLSCQQCSHYSNFRLAGKLPTPADARREYSSWSNRVRPRRFALLGGEPLLNPHLIEHLRLARQYWSDSNLMLVTNGFFFDRHPELPATLVDTNCRLEVSQHGTHQPYVDRFNTVKRTVWQWRADYPAIRIKIRQSHRGWMQQYRVEDGKPMPFDSKPETAYRICMQKTCTQLFRERLWKCPALAYFALMEQRLKLETIPAWQLFRDYKACPASASDEELQTFVEAKAIPQCGLCPSKRVPFKHRDPTQSGKI
ncbi:radical SAM protein [Novipirellula caenicola]|uniref:Radical SAM core domain-containing protein n=1 Tax=Novipirellula caenicola TaxID=1536901 RepID=A0ABP9VVJ5_9BACT